MAEQKPIFESSPIVLGEYGPGPAYTGPNMPTGHLELINSLLRSMGKNPIGESEVLVRPLRLTGNMVTSIYTRFKNSDLYQLASKMPGAPLLVAHNTETLPLGTFYKAGVTQEGENLWLDTWFYVLNDAEGQNLVNKIDKGIFNEASIGWTFTYAECSICGKDYYNMDVENPCTHVRGQVYNGKECYIYTTGEITPLEGSIVYRGAHPKTRVGGPPMAAKYAALSARDLQHSKMKRLGLAAHPDQHAFGREYKLSDAPSWKEPDLSDFLEYLKKPQADWESLDIQEKSFIAAHFAYAPSDDPSEYSFTDLKLAHHALGGELSFAAVKSAAQRLASLSLPESERSRIQAHLSLHYHQLGHIPPWDADPSAWQSYVTLSHELAKGMVTTESLRLYQELRGWLFEVKQPQEEHMQLKIKFGTREAEIAADTPEALSQALQAEIDGVLGELGKQVSEAHSRWVEADAARLALEKQLGEVQEELRSLKESLGQQEARAKLADELLADLVESAMELRISLEGAEAAESYRPVLQSWAERGEHRLIKAEIARMSKAKENLFPSGRLSVANAPETRIPRKHLSNFKLR